jgi:hypothetical protein
MLQTPPPPNIPIVPLQFCDSCLSTAGPLCGLLVRVPGYRSRGPGSILGATRLSVVSLEQSPLSLVSTIVELLERKCSGFGLENRNYGHRGSAALTT